MKKTKIDKLETLKKQLANELHEEVSLHCRIYGPITFTVGSFLDTGIVHAKAAEEMPDWHADQLVFPVTKSLMRFAKDVQDGVFDEEVGSETV